MNRVIITRPMMNLLSMQVCAIKDATDNEILEVCNTENPSGTSGGWTKVVRELEEEKKYILKKMLPVKCAKYPDRIHFIVLC